MKVNKVSNIPYLTNSKKQKTNPLKGDTIKVSPEKGFKEILKEKMQSM